MSKTIYDDRYVRMIEFMKVRRLALGLRQEDVAKKLGWDRNKLSRIEIRERRMDVLEAVAVARVLRIGIAKLLRDMLKARKGSDDTID